MIDSHCHLNCLTGDVEDFLAKAKKSGVDFLLCPGIEPSSFADIVQLANDYDNVKAGLGVHPNEVSANNISADKLYDYANRSEVIAIGETGLDYYRDSSDQDLQKEQFINHIEVAKSLNKPLIIHARDSHSDILEILQQRQAGPAIFHCFTATTEIAKAAINLGCLISFSGIVTFKNAKALQKVVTEIDLQNILIETDAPYLAPEPYRGKMNQPAYLPYTAKKIAELKDIDLATVIKATTNNFIKMFPTVALL